jgi:hypothetical protein
LFLQPCLQRGELRDDRLGVSADPPVVDEPDWDRIEVVELLPSNPAGRQQTGVFEDAEVLHHAESGHRQVVLELSERLAISLEEAVQQQSAVWIRQRSKDLVHAAVDR